MGGALVSFARATRALRRTSLPRAVGDPSGHLLLESRTSLLGALTGDWLPGQRHPQEKISRPRGEGRNERAWREHYMICRWPLSPVRLPACEQLTASHKKSSL